MYLQLGVIFLTLFQIVRTEKCVTPNNEEAKCVPIYSCQILIDALKTKQNESIEFVRKSKCEGRESDRMVCCGSTSGFLAPTTNKNDDKDKLLPNRTYCGYQHSDYYFKNETAIGINEFPWLAGLVFKERNKTIIVCSGSLISNRYVLTEARCIIPGQRFPTGVRLGEYIIAADNCTEDSGFYECNEPIQHLYIEKTIRHPQHAFLENNIGLVRLSRKVQYSDYIRPICLPTAGTIFAKPGDSLSTSAWGVKTNIRKEFSGKLITNEECRAATGTRYGITENIFCINVSYHAACSPSGGSTIFSFRNQWHQEGIATGFCYSERPHTKVVNYLEWIKENIEP